MYISIYIYWCRLPWVLIHLVECSWFFSFFIKKSISSKSGLLDKVLFNSKNILIVVRLRTVYCKYTSFRFMAYYHSYCRLQWFSCLVKWPNLLFNSFVTMQRSGLFVHCSKLIGNRKGLMIYRLMNKVN